jgi:hypothetical protein
MTLIQFAGSPQRGLWLCVDTRVTMSHTGQIVDDERSKIVRVTSANGEIAFAFQGVAEIAGRPTARWIARMLAARSFTNEEALRHLVDRLEQEGPVRPGLAVSAILADRDADGRAIQFAYFESANFDRTGRRTFGYNVLPVRDVVHGRGGTGANAIRDSDTRSVYRVLNAHSTDRDVARVLASINRSVSRRMSSGDHANTVGPDALTAYIPVNGIADSAFDVHVGRFTKPFEPIVPVVITMPHGIGAWDMTDLLEHTQKVFRAYERGEEPPEAPNRDWFTPQP